jgi:predicted metal-dependent hydrolase
MTASESASAAVKPVVRARRIRFSYPAGSLPRHYVGGDLVMSHVVAHLSALFPEGEDFFVRSVRRFADQITDPESKSRVQGFIGQEITHGREHRLLNERLQQMGYPTRRIDRMTHRDFMRFERLLSPLTCLAITAAFEHFTAVLAETLLSDERAQALLGSTEVRSMLLWHAIEGIRTPLGRIRRLPFGRRHRDPAPLDYADHPAHLHRKRRLLLRPFPTR